MTFTEKTDEELIVLHQQARDAYYADVQDIMTDHDFNDLEAEMDLRGLEYNHGSEFGSTVQHFTRMYSLKKFNVNADESNLEELYNAMLAYFHKTSEFDEEECDLTCEFKWDGLAVNMMYEHGKLIEVATRGSYAAGRSVLQKLKRVVPWTIENKDVTEIRGEVVVPTQIFIDKYADIYANPRGLAVGILGSDDDNDPRIKDLQLKIHGCKMGLHVINDALQISDVIKKTSVGLPSSLFKKNELTFSHCDFASFKQAYLEMKMRRSSIECTTDGMVVKFTRGWEKSNDIDTIEDSGDGHYPYYAVAFKFPAPRFQTKVTTVVWNLKKSGEYIPNVRYVPVMVEGRAIKKCTGVNYGWINDRGIWPGAEIEIGIMGDIIPFLQSVVKPAPRPANINLPEKVEIVGLHAYSTDSEQFKFLQKMESIARIGFMNLGWSTFEKLAKMVNNWYEIFDLTYEKVVPVLKPAKASAFIDRLDLLFDTGINFNHVLYCMCFKGLGGRTTDEVARALSGLEHNFSGLVRKDIDYVLNGEGRTEFESALACINRNMIPVIPMKERKKIESAQNYVLTGSPKPHFKTKSEFQKSLPENWVEVGKFDKDTLLITDDLTSTTSKMHNAKSLGCEIRTYESFVNQA